MTLIKSVSGIRGTIGGKTGESLTPIDVARFAAAYGEWVKSFPQPHCVVVGRDARISGKIYTNIVLSTLMGMGIDVIDIGLSTTPTVQMAVLMDKLSGGIMVSASHNPMQWNALKLFDNNGEYLSEKDGNRVLEIAANESMVFPDTKKLGKYSHDTSYLKRHVEQILALELVDTKAIRKKNFKVVIDCINSTGGIVVPMLLEALGVKTIQKLNCEPDGHFAHNPEPLPEHLTQISSELKNGKYDLGIVVDPDVDRLCFVCEDGSMFGEEYTLVAIADYVLKHKKGCTVSNLSSSRALRDITEKAGATYHTCPVGEYYVVKKMKECKAVIGGEGNGGIILPELHYGRDALAGIALFLTHLAHFGKPISMLRAGYPNYYISKNKIELTPELDIDLIINEIKTRYHKQPINTEDGVRIDFDKEWVHLRKSNTEPIIRIYAESETQTTADNLANKIISDIREVISGHAGILR
ncbi:MAG: phosphoglucosamine mutase [Cytophagaceae bacterium]|nr:phosphoglucosamine mutase [Cytophagaceae bacterium]MDW8456305.1 phosphoglucosamine mutase [Cytophagaceae bacterium]